MYATAAPTPSQKPVSVPSLRKMKHDGTPIVALTGYDASFAHVLDGAGIDVVLVGDSLGMVVQGHATTLPVTVDDIVYHCAAVRRGLSRALLMADMPFLSYATPEQALATARRLLVDAGAAMVKLEGGQDCVVDVIRFLVEREVPVCAHLGLTPQSVLRMGGFRVQGREEAAQKKMIEQAHAVAAAGAEALVLECVPAKLAAQITRSIDIPTIGIGAGVDCDGQILVSYDLLGITPGKRVRFTKDFLIETGSVHRAIERYAEDVRARRFPGPEHSF
ncbi:MAG: 3-methyl-2-oxobutanoate hydroxymethyltransferase [Rhodanobacteraceae bacterium]|nr:3-methyl-2-oxobutanoate hydroxymethyltransferase [Rhodanobacteraceae bacterium]